MNADNDDNDAELIREQAATWIARLEGGELSAEARADFEAWLSADPRHALVFRRMTRRFENARLLRGSRAYAPVQKRISRRFYPAVAGGALAAAIALVILIPVFHAEAPERSTQPPGQAIASRGREVADLRRRITTPEGAIRSVGLPDGSTVTLDGGSIVAVSFTRQAMELALLRGRARFSVAHSPRPFVVEAGSGSVIARGTVFDVSIHDGGRVNVVLLRGTIDVTPSVRSNSPDSSKGSRLTAGDTAAFVAGDFAPPPEISSAQSRWADRVGEFDDVPLAYILDRANLYATKPIRVAEPGLGQRRVSGRFRVENADRLANNLANLFGLRVEAKQDVILLNRQ